MSKQEQKTMEIRSIDALLGDIRKEALAIALPDRENTRANVFSQFETLTRQQAQIPVRRQYHKYEFLVYDDKAFVENAYRGILRREVDEAGLDERVAFLRAGGSKEQILRDLLDSEEAKNSTVVVMGLYDDVIAESAGKGKQDSVSIYALMCLDGEAFVRRAYEVLLKRAVDEGALLSNLQQLQKGVSKKELVVALLDSEEGRRAGVHVDGLGIYRLLYALYRIPLLGRIVRMATQIVDRKTRLSSDERAYEILRHYTPWLDRFQQTEMTLERNTRFLQAQDDWLKDSCDGRVQTAETVNAMMAQLQDDYRQFIAHSEAQNQRLGEALQRNQQLESDLKLVRQDLLYHQQRLAQLMDGAAEVQANVPARPAPHRDAILDAYYLAFENECRGSEADIRASLEVYLPFLGAADGAKVLDLGCGRGEWLALLQERGFDARGVDLNSVMVERCQEQGLNATCVDAVDYLSTQESGSFRAVSGFHIIEHLEFSLLFALFTEAARVLEEGGVLIFETPNPENLLVASHTFYHDPTHRNPITPTLAQFMARYFGFVDIEILRLHPYPRDAKVKGRDALTERVNGHLCGPQDFALLARKAAV